MAFHRIKFVTVNPFDFYGDTVYQKQAVLDFAGTDTNPIAKAFDTFPILID